jgi:hypothetical protein
VGQSSRILKQSWKNPKIVSQTVSHRLSWTPNSLLHTQLELEARVGIGLATVTYNEILPAFPELLKRTLPLFFQAGSSTFTHVFTHVVRVPRVCVYLTSCGSKLKGGKPFVACRPFIYLRFESNRRIFGFIAHNTMPMTTKCSEAMLICTLSMCRVIKTSLIKELSFLRRHLNIGDAQYGGRAMRPLRSARRLYAMRLANAAINQKSVTSRLRRSAGKTDYVGFADETKHFERLFSLTRRKL